jgi:hypothetical protein
VARLIYVVRAVVSLPCRVKESGRVADESDIFRARTWLMSGSWGIRRSVVALCRKSYGDPWPGLGATEPRGFKGDGTSPLMSKSAASRDLPRLYACKWGCVRAGLGVCSKPVRPPCARQEDE